MGVCECVQDIVLHACVSINNERGLRDSVGGTLQLKGGMVPSTGQSGPMRVSLPCLFIFRRQSAALILMEKKKSGPTATLPNTSTFITTFYSKNLIQVTVRSYVGL